MLSKTRLSIAAALACGALLAAGCGGSEQSSAPATTATTAQPATNGSATKAPAKAGAASNTAGSSRHCIQVSDGLVQKILGQVVLDKAQLSNVSAVASGGSPGYYFVSASVRGGGGKGVATWAVHGLDTHGPVYSVDSFAALVSDYGASTAQHPLLNLTAPGAYRSRVCAAGPSVSHGSPAPFPGGSSGSAG